MKSLARSHRIWIALMLVLVLSACEAETRDTTGVEPDAVVVEEPAVGEEAEQELEEAGEEAEAEVEEAAGDVAADADTAVVMGVTGADQETMILASTLLNREVENSNEEELGHVEDFLIDLETGNVLFALIEHGGFLDIGDEDAAVPLNALALGPERDKLILNVTEEMFDTFPDVNVSNDWPIGLGETWDDDLNVFWSEAGFNVRNLERETPSTVVRATQLIGFGMGAPTTPGLGTTVDYIVDLGQGRVKYALVGFADVGVYGEDLAVIPFTALDPAAFGAEVVLDPNIDPTLLTDAPRILTAEVNTLEFFEPGWDESARAYWTEQGYDFD